MGEGAAPSMRGCARTAGGVAVPRPTPTALAALVLLAAPALLRANGGTLRLADIPVGPWRMSVFTAPTPVRPDSLDVSVLVTAEDAPRPVDGVDVRVTLTPLDPPGPGRTLVATRARADDPRYYATKTTLGHEGRWRVDVFARKDGFEGGGAFEITATRPGLLDRPLVVLTVALLPLLLAAWWLRGNRASPSRRGTDEGPGGRLRDPSGGGVQR